MKILIINPPAYKNKDYIREGRCMQTKSSWAALWMPLSLAYTAAVLRKDKHRIRLIDCIAGKVNLKKLTKTAFKFSPGLIIVNTAFPSIKGDMRTARILKRNCPGVKIMAFGLYPSLLEVKFMRQFPWVDFIVVGEPEWTTRELARALENKAKIGKVNGLVYRDRTRKKIIKNKPQDLGRNNLDDLPFPARDLLDNEAYRLPINNEKFTLLSVGRGCPFSCIYCTANVYYGKKFRKRKVNRIVDEIEECLNRYGIKNFLFWGESFTLDQDYGEKICDEILRRNLKIVWSTTSRVDTLNQRLLDKMKKAGCVMLGLGIESINQDILDKMKKGIKVEQVKQAIKMVKKAKIKVMGHFIFGLPGETEESAKRSRDFALKSRVEYAQFYCAVPYPKTELGALAKEKGWVETKNVSRFDLTDSVMRNEVLSSKEIKRLRDRAYRSFYLRPRMFFQALKEVNSLRTFLS
ncbi:B12-binding domain-containing radical SAM protein, partial [Patescibacteria group bacterium]|nr:B12-binding domain-containing radical SAM protein [Patescibacteria group bacterium]